MKTFSNEPLYDVISYIKTALRTNNAVCIKVLNPAPYGGHYSGTPVLLESVPYICRSYKSYFEIADFLKLRCAIICVEDAFMTLRYSKIDSANSFHNVTSQEKYATNSTFAKIDKNEESGFLLYYIQALLHCGIEHKCTVLDLGINSGDEFEVIATLTGKKRFAKMELTGIDTDASAVETAKKKFPNANFFIHDINALSQLQLNRFDVIISIGTLQSPNIDFDATLKFLTKNCVAQKGSIILGFPNARWIDGELFYGAKAKNYAFNEMSVVLKDVMFAKRYLQQQSFRVTLTGKEYLFLTAHKL